MPLPVFLETFQTYHAIFRAVKPEYLQFLREHRRLPPTAANQTRDMPLQSAFDLNQRTKGTRAFKFVKDLVLEVPRFPLTCRQTLLPASSLVAEAAF
jgi:hypothetical protein